MRSARGWVTTCWSSAVGCPPSENSGGRTGLASVVEQRVAEPTGGARQGRTWGPTCPCGGWYRIPTHARMQGKPLQVKPRTTPIMTYEGAVSVRAPAADSLMGPRPPGPPERGINNPALVLDPAAVWSKDPASSPGARSSGRLAGSGGGRRGGDPARPLSSFWYQEWYRNGERKPAKKARNLPWASSTDPPRSEVGQASSPSGSNWLPARLRRFWR